MLQLRLLGFSNSAAKIVLKTLFAILFLGAALIVSPSESRADSPNITFFWDAPTTVSTGFKIYWRTPSVNYSAANTFAVANPSATTYSTSQLAEGTYYFRVVALNQSNVESAPSNEVTLYAFRPLLETGSAIGKSFSVMLSAVGSSSPLVNSNYVPTATGNILVPVNSPVPATFDLKFKTACFLAHRFGARGIGDASAFTALLAGDIDNNNLVNSLDWNILSADYFQSAKSSDLNGDGISNSVDLSFLSKNYFVAGD